MINEQKIESDRNYVKLKVGIYIDKFFDDFKKNNNKLMEAEKTIKKLEYSRTIYARAYAIRIGLILTRKQFEKLHNSAKKRKER